MSYARNTSAIGMGSELSNSSPTLMASSRSRSSARASAMASNGSVESVAERSTRFSVSSCLPLSSMASSRLRSTTSWQICASRSSVRCLYGKRYATTASMNVEIIAPTISCW